MKDAFDREIGGEIMKLWCNHEWRLYEQSLHGRQIHICDKCGKVKDFKHTKFEVTNNYLFCPKCGFELTRMSHRDSVNVENGFTVEHYQCNRCKTGSMFNFGVAPVAVRCDEKGYILK